MDTTSYIVGVGSVESSYLTQSSRCFTNFNHPDLPALMVYCQYLTQLEGPMWQHIRGLGLAYDYGLVFLWCLLVGSVIPKLCNLCINPSCHAF